MRIFLSSRYSRRDELCDYRSTIESLGHEVVSRWLNTQWEETEETREAVHSTSAAPASQRQRYAAIDLEDVEVCDILIAFSDPPENKGRRGGRHVELGYALGRGKKIILVGPEEHIFHYHSIVNVCRSTQSFVNGLEIIKLKQGNVPIEDVSWICLLT